MSVREHAQVGLRFGMLVGIERKWRPLPSTGLGVASTISQLVARIEYELPYLIPDLRAAPRLLIASDYGGDHSTKRGARYRALSFLIADQFRLRVWRKGVDALRQEQIRDTRE